MAGLGGLLSGAFGSDNGFTGRTPDVDKNAYMFGGTPSGANDQRNHSLGLAGQYGQTAQTGIDNSLAARQQQNQLIGQLQLQASGGGPSAAQAQLQSATNAANANAASMANSARGGPLAQAAAQRQAQFQGNQNVQNAGAQSAAIKAQEQMSAQNALGGVLGQQRQGDLGLAGLGAGAQAGFEGQGIQVGEDQLNAGMRGQQQQSENELQTQALNAKLAEEQANRNDQNAQFGIGTVAGALGALSDARLKDHIHSLQASRMAALPPVPQAHSRTVIVGPGDRFSYEDAPRTSEQGYGSEPSSHAQAYSDFYLKNNVHPLAQAPSSPTFARPPAYAPYGIGSPPSVGGGSAAQTGQIGVPEMLAAPSARSSPAMVWSDEELKNSITPLGMQAAGGINGPDFSTTSVAPMRGGNPSDLQPYAPRVSADQPTGTRDRLARMGGGDDSSSFGKGKTAGADIAGGLKGLVNDSGGMGGAGAGAAANGAGGGLMAYSDKRLKNHVSSAEPSTDDFMSHLHGYGYHYKPGVPGEDPSQQRYGIIAQQVASSPMGSSIVDKTPIGLAIDIPHAIGPIMAAEGDLYRKHLEDAKNIALLKKRAR